VSPFRIGLLVVVVVCVVVMTWFVLEGQRFHDDPPHGTVHDLPSSLGSQEVPDGGAGAEASGLIGVVSGESAGAVDKRPSGIESQSEPLREAQQYLYTASLCSRLAGYDRGGALKRPELFSHPVFRG
jgi:hypothetical protein